MRDLNDLRLRNLEATIADLRRERAADRALIREILAQVLTLTDKQTSLLGEWTALLHARHKLLDMKGSPRTYVLTEEEEYRQYVQKHHPELLEPEDRPDYGVTVDDHGDGQDREVG